MDNVANCFTLISFYQEFHMRVPGQACHMYRQVAKFSKRPRINRYRILLHNELPPFHACFSFDCFFFLVAADRENTEIFVAFFL